MTNPELARGWIRQAKHILDEAQHIASSKLWHLVVRRCQESVEMSLKGLLGLVGIEIPHIHDVGFLIKQHRDRFPAAIQKEVGHIQSISRRLKQERETSFYGDEELMLPPDELYTEEDAHVALRDAQFIWELAHSQLNN